MPTAKMTSFATYKDLVGYIKCLLNGGSENYCYSKGDNGVGSTGKITAQEHTPMVALPKAEVVAKWGSVKAAAGKRVRVQLPSCPAFEAEYADTAPAGVCDLNPASLKAAGLSPETELNVTGTWEWI